MTLVDLVPSPYHILHQITAALGSSLPGLSLAPMSHKSTPRTNYDVNPTTGFAPERPLPRLPDAFAMWEQHLDDAIGCIYLGTEEEDKSSVERQRAEEWREAIHSVRSAALQDEVPKLIRPLVACRQYCRVTASSSAKGALRACLACTSLRPLPSSFHRTQSTDHHHSPAYRFASR